MCQIMPYLCRCKVLQDDKGSRAGVQLYVSLMYSETIFCLVGSAQFGLQRLRLRCNDVNATTCN